MASINMPSIVGMVREREFKIKFGSPLCKVALLKSMLCACARACELVMIPFLNPIPPSKNVVNKPCLSLARYNCLCAKIGKGGMVSHCPWGGNTDVTTKKRVRSPHFRALQCELCRLQELYPAGLWRLVPRRERERERERERGKEGVC